MRLAFMGTPDFSVPVLDALHQAGHEIACVYSQPPRPAGRGKQLRPSPVHARAEALGLPVRTPQRLRDPADQAAFAELALDAAVVVAYGLILPRPILAAPRLGCINVHASLLPRWRGAAPIQRAIMAGDTQTGVTIMQMDAGLDTGPMLLREAVPITDATTGEELHDALSALGARLILPALAGLADGSLKPEAQPDDGVTYAAKLTTEDERLDWQRSASALARQVRALSPRPGAFTTLDGERLRVAGAEVVAGSGEPGTILDDRLTIACGTGALRLTLVQAPGKRMMPAGDFLRGRAVPRGTRLT